MTVHVYPSCNDCPQRYSRERWSVEPYRVVRPCSPMASRYPTVKPGRSLRHFPIAHGTSRLGLRIAMRRMRRDFGEVATNYLKSSFSCGGRPASFRSPNRRRDPQIE